MKKPVTIICPRCGEVVEVIDWGAHKMQHRKGPLQSSLIPNEKC